MTSLIHRPTAHKGSSGADDTLTRPPEIEKQPVKPSPPPEKRRPYFRWLGWLVVIAVVGIVAGILYANGTSDTETVLIAERPAVTPQEQAPMPVEIPPVRALAPLPDMPTNQPWPLPGPSLGPWALETYEMAFVLENQPTVDASMLETAVVTPRWTLGPWTLQGYELAFVTENQPTYQSPATPELTWTLGPWTLQADELNFILENQPEYGAELIGMDDLAEFASRGNRSNLAR